MNKIVKTMRVGFKSALIFTLYEYWLNEVMKIFYFIISVLHIGRITILSIDSAFLLIYYCS